MSASPPSLDSESGMIAAGLASIAAASPPALQHFTLENGLSVYLREDHGMPLVAAQLWYHVGTRHEPPGHSNLSHLLEHLMFSGSRKLAPGQYSRAVARLGGKANATTRNDATAFDIVLPATRLPIALEMMADAMAHATLGRDAFEREIKAIEDERRLKLDNSWYLQSLDQHHRLAHEGSPYAEPTFGHPVDLNEMQWASVHTWYRTWYVPNNATLVVVGAVDLQSLRQQVKACFAGIPRSALPAPQPLRQPVEWRERSQTLVRPDLRGGLHLSFNVPSQATAQSPQVSCALRLLCEVLGKGFSSRLYGNLVRDRQLLRGLVIDYQHLCHGDTLLTLSATTGNATPQEAAQAIREIIEDLRRTPLPDEVLEHAKLRLLARQLYTRDSNAWQAEQIGQAAAIGLDPSLLDREPELLRSLTGSMVRQIASQYLQRERSTATYLLQGAGA